MNFEQLPDKMKTILKKADEEMEKVIPWIANLYDPQTGGFYFAMSGKNDPNMEPTIGTTAWGIKILKEYTDIVGDMPENIRQKMIQFFHDRQDPETGFYVDKQGPVDDRDKARNQGAGLQALDYLNANPIYPHPSETEKKEDTSLTGTAAGMPAYMESVDTYMNWVESLGWTTSTWADGDKVQASQNFVKALPKEKRTEYVTALLNWFDAHQNPETGFWAENDDFNAVSGAFKIAWVYLMWNRALPNIDKIIDSTIQCYRTYEADKPFYVRNPLTLFNQIAGYSPELRKKIQDVVLENIDLMMATFGKNQCPDGGYSAWYQKSGTTYHGIVTSHGLFEGDTNATLMILIAREELYNIFEVTAPPLKADHFWDWITGKQEMPSPYLAG